MVVTVACCSITSPLPSALSLFLPHRPVLQALGTLTPLLSPSLSKLSPFFASTSTSSGGARLPLGGGMFMNLTLIISSSVGVSADDEGDDWGDDVFNIPM